MSHWKDVEESKAHKIHFLKRKIPGYDYSHEDLAHKTDEGLSRLIVEKVREIKSSLFNSIQTSYELHKDLLLKDLEHLKDELDIFSDEVKVRTFEWGRSKPREWLEKLVDHDYRLVSLLEDLEYDMRKLEKEFVSSSDNLSDQRRIASHIDSLYKRTEELVYLFKERDAICNIRDNTYDRTFEAIRSRIRKGF